MRISRKTLGLAVTRQTIAAVEVVASRGRCRLEHVAEMSVSGERGLDNPAELGMALKEFLRVHHFSASRCVIGLEAAHLAAKEKRLPEAAMGSLDDILRLAAEQDFASDEQELIFDYVGSSEAKATCALLVAAPRRVVDQVLAAASAAGLSVVAVTSSALALAQASASPAPSGQRLVLSLSQAGCELVVQSHGAPRLMRRLPVGPGATPVELEAELQRVLAVSMPEAQAAPGELLVWNATELGESALPEMGKHLGMPTRICRFPTDLGLEGPVSQTAGNLAAAAALAVAHARSKGRALDFLHSRLAPRTRRRVGKLAVWATVAAAVVVAALVSLLLDWRSSQQQIADMQARLSGLDPSVRRAKNLIDKASFARGWYDRRLPMLDCLRAVTLAFPEEGRIWATSLAVREDMTVSLSGKASGKGAVLDLLDRLNASPALTEIKLQYTRQSGTNTQEVSFAINIHFAGAE